MFVSTCLNHLQIADQLWPKPPPATNTTEENEEEDEGEEDIEKQLAKELSDLNNAKSKDSPDRRIGQADAPSYVNWINASPQQVARPRLRVVRDYMNESVEAHYDSSDLHCDKATDRSCTSHASPHGTGISDGGIGN